MTDRSNDPTVVTHTPSTDGADRRARSLSEGERLGRYTILRLLGRGGMGAVYEAEDPELGRRVAIKILHEGEPGSRGDREGLRREAQALATLVHQNVVMVYDVGVDEAGDVFLVMQLVEGETINAWIERTKPSPDEVIEKFRLAGEGLQGAHDAGLVHCDFKPQNVLIDDEGAVRVGDFGLARRSSKITSGPGQSLPTRMTTLAGTPAYMAPEQFEGLVTKASDQFAFCVALWECLAGERPFEDSSVATLDPASRGPRRELARTARMPRYVRRVLERGLADQPAARFPSMRALLDALRPPRSKLPLVAAAVGAAAISGGVVYFATRADSDGNWRGADTDHPVRLTNFGVDACAYAPMIDPGGTVVFDRTRGDIVDLYSVPLAGGPLRRLTATETTWEWRAQPGRRAGEVSFLIHDRADETKSKVAYLDLDTGEQTTVLNEKVWDAATVDDAVYYSPNANKGIRVLQGNQTRPFVTPPSSFTYYNVTAAASGNRLGITRIAQNAGSTSSPCVIDLVSRLVRCIDIDTNTRPAFGGDPDVLYVAGLDGIYRHHLIAGVTTRLTTDYAEGGIAIAPDGKALVYSLCRAHTTVVDLHDNTTLIDDRDANQPTPSHHGALAWIRSDLGRNVLMLRSRDGRTTQLSEAAWGSIGHPRFSRDDKYIAFGKTHADKNAAATATDAGIYYIEVGQVGSLRQLTTGSDDRSPHWTKDHIGFTRTDASANDHVWVTRLDGHLPRELLPGPSRTLYGSDDTRFLVGSEDNMYWVDPKNPVEQPGPRRPEGEMLSATTSPSGNWVVYQIGSEGLQIYRARTTPDAPYELVKRFESSWYVTDPSITDDGHVLISGGPWYGDLYKIDVRDGYTF